MRSIDRNVEQQARVVLFELLHQSRDPDIRKSGEACLFLLLHSPNILEAIEEMIFKWRTATRH